ncbi:hypothetical protein ATO10_03325 [Actibacterium atlanticum]|uniref:Oxidoreductase n=2 Tax=Actibacterium atlanticum TaxID=1461693 RepID=A0A058ZQB9_9RHOB|nr:hypothetical protein ATO10_03325 [Actibacterium atlanticum]
MMCAAHAGPDTLVIDHAKAAGEKIRISGGGRCNFTNMYASAENFISQNNHFAKSSLARYTQWDFVELMGKHSISWHEKTLGQLFCDDTARDVVTMLLSEMTKAGAELWLQTTVTAIAKTEGGFALSLSDGRVLRALNVVVATGGKSIPKMGASGFGYKIAEQFGHTIVETRPALVPLTFGDRFSALSGTSLATQARANGASFDEATLFTHRGLSGPAILQISSYWREGDTIALDLLPDVDAFSALRELRSEAGKKSVNTVLGALVPSKLAQHLCDIWSLDGNMADYSDTKLRDLASKMHSWHLTPTGSEGYRTAEVTLGGVDTDGLNARTMESKTVPGLYFIGEVVDVTGWLGGYNFQWAWSSGHAAGTALRA